MKDFINEIQYYGLTARVKRLSDNLYHEARKIYQYLGYEIEPNWHLIILLLKKHETLSVTEIAKHLGLSHPAIIKITKKMKELDYIISLSDKHDSRKSLLALSEKCKTKLPTFDLVWSQIQNIVQECVEDDFLNHILFFEEKLSKKSLSERFKALNENNTTRTS